MPTHLILDHARFKAVTVRTDLQRQLAIQACPPNTSDQEPQTIGGR